MDIQPKAEVENQDRAQCGQNEAGGMIAFICRTRKHVGDAAADDRSDDAERDRPEKRYVHVHDVFRDNPRNEANQKVPDQVKHAFFHPLPLERRRILARGRQFAGISQCGLLALQLRGSRGCVLFTIGQFAEFYGAEAVPPGSPQRLSGVGYGSW
jgi:hypothetical protein